jgi:hypothetical protein
MTDRPTLLYILAPSFSGSTLLTYLLAQHAEISTVGEFKATQMGPPEDYHCSCGTPILDCKFWRSMKDKADARGIDFNVDRFGTVFEGTGSFSNKVVSAGLRGSLFETVRTVAMRTLPGVSSRLHDVAKKNRDLAEIVCEIQGGSVFLDGSKDSVRLLHMINSDMWNVKVIYLQRDGRGVSSSIMKHTGLAYGDAVGEWTYSATELQRMRARLRGSQVFDVHYEQLCDEPTDTMRQIWSWLGLEHVALNEREFKSGDYHILGNAMRLGGASEIRLDEKWKRTLSEDELRIFEEQAGSLNRQLGYA